MHPRILIKEQGQNKKRFISPTEVKNNQAIYGNPLGSSKLAASGQTVGMNLDRMYSPENRRSIIELERQESSKNIGVKNQHIEKISEGERMRSIGQNPKQQPTITTAKSTSKSKSKLAPQVAKKDYMSSTLAKLARQKTKQSDQQSNGSQSRSKINSIKNDKQTKTTDQEYTQNVYHHKQIEVKRRPRNNDSHSQASSVQSEDGFGLQKNERNDAYGKQYAKYEGHASHGNSGLRVDVGSRKSPQTGHGQNNALHTQPPISPTVRPNLNAAKNAHTSSFKEISLQKDKQKLLTRKNEEKSYPVPVPSPQLQFVKRPSAQQNQTYQQKAPLSPRDHSTYNQPFPKSNQEKISLTSVQQSRTYESQRSHIQDSNNSTLVVHLKKAHQQKDELLQKKIQAQKERNELKTKAQRQQQQLIQLRNQLQQMQVQNLSLNSELKSIRQTQTKTKNEVQDTNQRNEHVYREVHEKYQQLVEDYRKAIFENDSLRQENERLKTEGINADKRVNFLESRGKQLESMMEQKDQQHRGQMRQSVEEWRGNLEKAEKELKKKQMQSDGSGSGSALGQLKIRLMECESELSHKLSLLKSREQETKSLKKQVQTKEQELQQVLSKKDREIKELAQDIEQIQRSFSDKFGEHEKQMKELQLKLARTQKDLNLKRIQSQQWQKKASQPSDQLMSNLYVSHLTPQSQQARQSLQAIISHQTQSLNSCKKQLNKSISQNFTLKSQLQQVKSAHHNLQQDVNILQMQYAALQKKLTQSKETEMYMMKSQLETAVRRQKDLEAKLESKAKEVKEKDQFIQGQLIRMQR